VTEDHACGPRLCRQRLHNLRAGRSDTGKTVTAKQGPEDAMVPALTAAGLNAHWAALYQEMIHGMNTGHVAFEGGKVRTAKGTTDVDVVLRRLIAPKG
jgi:hypothetical protein